MRKVADGLEVHWVPFRVGSKERVSIVEIRCGLARETEKSYFPMPFTEGCAHPSLRVE